MSFLLVTQYYPPERGAAQVRLGAIVADLHRRGNEVDVVTAIPNYPLGRFFDGWRARPVDVREEDGVRVVRVWVHAAMGSGVGRIVNYLSFGVMSLVGLLRARRHRWWIVEYPTLFGAFPAVLVGSMLRRRVVVIVADLWIDSIHEMGTLGDGVALRVLRRLERWMLRRADVVTAVTQGVRDRLVEIGVPRERLAWLPNGADTDRITPGPVPSGVLDRFGLAEGDEYVLYAGTHGVVHGLDVVLDAASAPEVADVTFVLVGDGSEKPALVARAADLGLTNVVFHDPVAPETVNELLRGALAGLACVREGSIYRTIRSAKMFPVMACGRPVVYSGDDEGSRLVTQTGAGIAVPPGDGPALAAAIVRLRQSPADASDLGATGRSWIVENLSWSHLIDRWLVEIESIAAARRGGSRA